MHKLLSSLFAIVVMPLTALTFATEVIDRPDLGKHFESAGVQGTFAMLDVSGDRLAVFDRARANQRFAPASTFKILNSLVALETGAVKDENEVIPYGGKPQRFKQWERDMNMRDAIRASNVPIYQDLARRAGTTRMKHYLAAAAYGNADMGNMIDRFWLEGPLAISAIEQTFFLRNLAQRGLPFSDRNMAIVRSILKQEETRAYALFAKTGWAMAERKTGDARPVELGWWVGWIERDGNVYAFALNVDIRSDEDAAKRQIIARNCLKALGLL